MILYSEQIGHHKNITATLNQLVTVKFAYAKLLLWEHAQEKTKKSTLACNNFLFKFCPLNYTLIFIIFLHEWLINAPN